MFTAEEYRRDSVQDSEYIDGYPCDLCGEKEHRHLAIQAPDKGGWYCRKCYEEGEVESYLKRYALDFGMNEGDLIMYLAGVNLKGNYILIEPKN